MASPPPTANQHDGALATADDDVIETPEERRLADDLITAFVRAIRGACMYPPENPLVSEFNQAFYARCQDFLARYPAFVMQISESTLSANGRTFYRNTELKSSIPFLLYNDGLRELRLTEGLEAWETDALVDIIHESFTRNSQNDDMVILLWERDFPHIDYLAIDNFLEEAAEVVPDNIAAYREKLVLNRLLNQDVSDLREFGGELLVEQSPMHDNAVALATDRMLYTLTPDDVQQLQRAVEQELAPTFVFSAGDVLFEIILLTDQADTLRDAAQILLRMLDAMVMLGDFPRAIDTMQRLRAMIEMPSLEPWRHDLLEEIPRDAGEAFRIERIGRLLAKEGEGRLEEIQHYLDLLQPNAIPAVVHLLAGTKFAKIRGMLCDVLVSLGHASITQLLPYLNDTRWFLVRNIVSVLGRIGDSGAITSLAKLAVHNDARVRRAVAQALGAIGGGRAVALLTAALQDTDADTRGIAALSLGKIGTVTAVLPLLQTVQSGGFHRKTPDEQQSFFDGIGISSSPGALPVLKRLLTQPSWWFYRRRAQALRIGAARALAMLGTPEARVLLETGRASLNPDLRLACTQAMSILPGDAGGER